MGRGSTRPSRTRVAGLVDGRLRIRDITFPGVLFEEFQTIALDRRFRLEGLSLSEIGPRAQLRNEVWCARNRASRTRPRPRALCPLDAKGLAR